MHLGEQAWNSCKKIRYFYCSCTFHCSHTLLVQDKLKLLVLNAEVEADKLKLSVQNYGTMAVLQFLSTARVSTQEWTAADIEGWRLAINRSFLSTKKAWIWNTISSLQTSKFIKQSQYQKILLQYQIIFSDHLFKSITNYNLSFS